MKSQKQDHEFDELEKEARDFLSPLQQLASPPSLRDKLRRATSTGIKQEGTALMEPVDTTTHFSRHRSLWKRKITVPLPLAAAILFFFVSLIGRDVMQAIYKTASEPATPIKQVSVTAQAQPVLQTTQKTNQPNPLNGCSPKAWREETFIAGLGPIATRNYISCEREEP